MTSDPLFDDLRSLARTLATEGITLTVGGGFGLLLRAQLVAARGADRLSEVRLPARSTGDIDCFLSVDIITNGDKAKAVRNAIDALGYSPKPDAKYFQFARTVAMHGQPREIGIDLLTGPIPESSLERVRIKEPRVAPRHSSGLHAYLTEEAFALEYASHRLDIGDADGQVDVLIPHPFAFLLLKLFALRDRLPKGNDAKQKYHAFDLYAIWADMSPAEYAEVQALVREHRDHRVVREAGRIVETHFADFTAIGAVALVEQAIVHGHRPARDAVEQFMHDLRVLFPVTS